jgi:Fanconi anemia group M protein
MARHLQKGLGYEISLRSGKPKSLSLQRQFLLEGLPGVGPVAAQRILAHFDNPLSVFSATEQELRAVKGVGPKMAANIRKVLVGSADK